MRPAPRSSGWSVAPASASESKPGPPGVSDMRWTIAIVVSILAGTAPAQEVRPKPSGVAATIDRGLAFLVKDARAWKKQYNCVSCHHAALVVWAMREAKQR